MDMEQVISALKKEVEINKIAKDICQLFINRERARKTLSVEALYKTLKYEGIKHERIEYASFLNLLAVLGIGRVSKDMKGRVKGLLDIRYTLKSVGEVALGQKQELDSYKPRKLLTSYNRPISTITTLHKISKTLPSNYKINEITVTLDGKPLKLQLPDDLTNDQLINIIKFFNT